jgi:cytochrome c biogenesis protein CcdA
VFPLKKNKMDFLNALIDQYNIPLLTAFVLGIMTSISPCPLATNITAIAYISKDIKTSKHTLISGLVYTLGRAISYTLLATLIYFGLSSFEIAKIFQGWGDKVLGIVLIFISLTMFGLIKIKLGTNNQKIEQMKQWLASKGYVGALLLGVLFALAFCPYSGVLFFGVLIPLVLSSAESLLLPPIPRRCTTPFSPPRWPRRSAAGRRASASRNATAPTPGAPRPRSP